MPQIFRQEFWGLRFLWERDASNSGLKESHMSLFFGGFKHKGLALDCNYLTDNAADGSNLIAYLKRIAHILRFLVSLFL